MHREFSVCIIERGSEVGAHIHSGSAFDAIALNELIPYWKTNGAPLNTPVTRDEFLILTAKNGIKFPMRSYG